MGVSHGHVHDVNMHHYWPDAYLKLGALLGDDVGGLEGLRRHQWKQNTKGGRRQGGYTLFKTENNTYSVQKM